MSYNLLAESARIEDWETLRRELRLLSERVELFPIVAEHLGDPDGIGISVSSAHANEDGWRDLERVLRRVLRESGMTVTDLVAGSRVSESTLEKVRKRLLGE
jgi:hypothetical protein